MVAFASGANPYATVIPADFFPAASASGPTTGGNHMPNAPDAGAVSDTRPVDSTPITVASLVLGALAAAFIMKWLGFRAVVGVGGS